MPVSVLRHAGRSPAGPGRGSSSQWRSTGSLNAQIEETFTGHAVVKAFGRQREVEQRFRDTNDELYESSFGAQFMSSLMQPFTMFIGNIQYVIVAVVGGLQVASGAISVGDVQAFIQYSRNFSMPLTQLASMMNVFQSGIASFERVIEFLDAEEQSPDAGRRADTRRRCAAGSSSTTSRSPTTPTARSSRTSRCVAEPGQTIAIVGPTGAGKTTLVNLIMRFYELDGGAITLDGRDIPTMPAPRAALEDRHGAPGHVAVRRHDPRQHRLRQPRRDRGADPRGGRGRPTSTGSCTRCPTATTPSINEEGDNISAGQKQLLTIARAFLADPAILILDEATSSVDTRTEVLIQEAMNALRKERTSFVIAHRLSTIRGADMILVMEHGRIVEQGSHSELLAHDGPYFRLYNSQFVAPAVEGNTRCRGRRSHVRLAREQREHTRLRTTCSAAVAVPTTGTSPRSQPCASAG